MSMPKHRAERDAHRALAELFVAADKVKEAYEIANLPIPGFLVPLIGGEDDDEGTGVEIDLNLVPMISPERPAGVDSSWIWVPTNDATLQTLALGIVRAAESPLSQQEFYKRLSTLRPDSPQNGIYNAFTRIRSKLTQTGLGFRLTDPKEAAVLGMGYAWGPPSSFSPFEVADFRRPLIMHLLTHLKSRGGATTSELREMIRVWPHQTLGAVQRDAVRADVNALAADHKIVQDPQTKRWTCKEDAAE